MNRNVRGLMLMGALSISGMPIVGCGGTEVDLSKEAIPTEVAPSVPIEQADPSSMPPGGGKSSSGNAGFNPGASS